jgi:SNF2-related domain
MRASLLLVRTRAVLVTADWRRAYFSSCVAAVRSLTPPRLPLAGRQRLLALFHDSMVRSSKDGMTGTLLPSLTKTIVWLPFQADHQASYNAFIEARSPVWSATRIACC